MLQRIQTVFLAVALLASLALFYTAGDVAIGGNVWLVRILAVISGLLSAFSIMSYMQRKRQIAVNNINLILNALLIGLLVFWLYNLSGGMHFPEKGIEPVFPVIAMFCLLMANANIRNDEKLVKSVDRLR